MNNNFTSPPQMSAPAFNAFNTPPTTTANDRYAALADLDLALRQQNMKQMEESNVNTKNPFQSTATNDMFANKNPFFNGGWSAPPPQVPVNPFAPTSHAAFGSSNPFL